MKNQLLLIIGPPLSGKTYLALVLKKHYGKTARIFDEPFEPGGESPGTIKRYANNYGVAIVTCSLVTGEQLQTLAPDRVYSIGIKQTR